MVFRTGFISEFHMVGLFFSFLFLNPLQIKLFAEPHSACKGPGFLFHPLVVACLKYSKFSDPATQELHGHLTLLVWRARWLEVLSYENLSNWSTTEIEENISYPLKKQTVGEENCQFQKKNSLFKIKLDGYVNTTKFVDTMW